MPEVAIDIAVGADDGWTERVDTVYPPVTNPNADAGSTYTEANQEFIGGNYKISVGLLRFVTSIIPDDATVTAALLRVWINGIADADSRNFVAEYYNFGAAIDTADWTGTVSSNAHAGTAISAITAGASRDFALQNLENINKTGNTDIRFGISGGQPTDQNYVSFDTLEHATSPVPQLVVTYDLPERQSFYMSRRRSVRV